MRWAKEKSLWPTHFLSPLLNLPQRRPLYDLLVLVIDWAMFLFDGIQPLLLLKAWENTLP